MQNRITGAFYWHIQVTVPHDGAWTVFYFKKGENTMTDYKKYYPTPEIILESADYFASENPRKILYGWRLDPQLPAEERESYTEKKSFYCLKCRKFKEVDSKDFYPRKTVNICSCGEKEPVAHRGRPDPFDAYPHRLNITEKDDKIRIALTLKDWRLNEKAGKPYVHRIVITFVINTATKQAYKLPTIIRGKRLENDGVKNIAFTGSEELILANRVFKNDPEAMTALLKIYAKHVPDVDPGISDLRELIDYNHLRKLYRLFPGYDRENSLNMDLEISAWRKLRRRYKQNPETFPKYLYYGCKKAATKSIKKLLYRYPEHKWTLQFLYTDLGITNVDILRSQMSERRTAAAKAALEYKFGFRELTEDMKPLLDACNAVLTDSEKVRFLFKAETAPHILRDTGRMMKQLDLGAEELRHYENVEALHDGLIELSEKIRNKKRFEKYSTPLEYSERINRLERKVENAEFRIIRIPWELQALGRKFHNCVGSYMSAVQSGRSIILEMEMHGKPSACIELDGSGKYCYQAYAACNKPLSDEAAEVFGLWVDQNKIELNHPHEFMAGQPF